MLHSMHPCLCNFYVIIFKTCLQLKGLPEKPYVSNQRAMRKIEDNQKKFADEMREVAQATLRDEFDNKAISKTMYNEIGRLVGCAKAAQVDDLNDKRVRCVHLYIVYRVCMNVGVLWVGVNLCGCAFFKMVYGIHLNVLYI